MSSIPNSDCNGFAVQETVCVRRCRHAVSAYYSDICD